MNSDFAELLQAFENFEVEYLVVCRTPFHERLRCLGLVGDHRIF